MKSRGSSSIVGKQFFPLPNGHVHCDKVLKKHFVYKCCAVRSEEQRRQWRAHVKDQNEDGLILCVQTRKVERDSCPCRPNSTDDLGRSQDLAGRAHSARQFWSARGLPDRAQWARYNACKASARARAPNSTLIGRMLSALKVNSIILPAYQLYSICK